MTRLMPSAKDMHMCAVLFVLLSSVYILCSERQSDSIATATNKFTADLLKVAHKLESKDENFVISTFSVYIALAILQQASRGDTQKELTAVIHAKHSLALQGCKSLIQDLKGPYSAAELQFATKLYLNNFFGVMSDFKDCMKQNFHSEVENINFLDPIAAVQKINPWVSNSTENKIQNITKRNDLSANAVSVFILAAFFSGQWQQKFKQELRDMTEFTYLNGTSRNICTMHLEKDLSAGLNTEIAAKFVRLPFSLGINAIFNPGADVRWMESSLLVRLNRKLTWKLMKRVSLPQQPQVGSTSVALFKANNSKVTCKTTINAVLYQYSPGQAVRYKEMEIKVDHPFLFSIFDIFNRLHLFSGWVGAPN